MTHRSAAVGLFAVLVTWGGVRLATADVQPHNYDSIMSNEDGATYFDDPQSQLLAAPNPCSWTFSCSPPPNPWIDEAGPGLTDAPKAGWLYQSGHRYGQIFVYVGAWDEMDLGVSSGAEGNGDVSWIKLQKTDGANHCAHMMRVDLKPRFSIRTEVLDGSVWGTQYVKIKGEQMEWSRNLNVINRIQGELRVDDDGGSFGTGLKLDLFGQEVSIDVEVSAESASEIEDFIATPMSKAAPCPTEIVEMTTVDDVSFHANGATDPLADTAIVYGILYQSLAGVRLKAWCLDQVPPSLIDPIPDYDPLEPPAGTGNCAGAREATASWYGAP